MAIVKKEVRICDYCETELSGDFVKTQDVPNEGCSEIIFKGKSYGVGGQDYCDVYCLTNDIRKQLGIT